MGESWAIRPERLNGRFLDAVDELQAAGGAHRRQGARVRRSETFQPAALRGIDRVEAAPDPAEVVDMCTGSGETFAWCTIERSRNAAPCR